MSTLKAQYQVSIAGWAVDSAADARTELLELETSLALDSPAGFCRLVLYAPPAPKPGLLEQAVGAAAGALGLGGAAPAGPPVFSVDVRGQKVAHGDQISVSLTGGDKSGQVITADLRAIDSSLGETRILGRSGAHRLTSTRLNQVYRNQTAGKIIKDLASQAGASAGQVEDGGTYPYFVVHESRNLWAHARELAAREGFDLWFDDANRLNCSKFTKTSADHTFYYGIDLLSLELRNYDPPAVHALVRGDGAAGSQGSDAWHWLIKDVAPVRGEAGQGNQTVALSDGAVRARDAAGRYATSKLGAIRDRSAEGRLCLLGNPAVKPAQAVEIKNVPKPELNGIFKVTSVRHAYNKREGFLTYVGFSGKGGAEAAGGLLGELAGAIGGALGI